MPDDKKKTLFIMAQPPTFTWPVKVRVPDAGKYQVLEFTATFPDMNEEQLEALIGNDPETGKPYYTNTEIAAQVLRGFDPLPLPDGSWVENDESGNGKRRLLEQPRVPMAVMSTFIAAVKGLAAEKND